MVAGRKGIKGISNNIPETTTRGMRTPSLLLRLIEIPQIGRPLPLLRRHEHAVGAEIVGLVLDPDVAVVLHAVVLDPPWMSVRAAAIMLGHRPRMRLGMIEDGDFVVDHV